MFESIECWNHANKIFLRLRHQTNPLTAQGEGEMASIHIQGDIIILAVFFSI